MANCLSCGSVGAYIGLTQVECPNQRCRHYVATAYITLGNLSVWAPISRGLPNTKLEDAIAVSMRNRGIPVDFDLFSKMLAETDCHTAKRLAHTRFLEKVEEDGRVHPHWRKGDVGRWISRGPNILAMPYSFLKCLKGPRFDFPQLEIHAMAELTGTSDLARWCQEGTLLKTLSDLLNVPEDQTRALKQALYWEVFGKYSDISEVVALQWRLQPMFPSFARYRHSFESQRDFTRTLARTASSVVDKAVRNAWDAGLPLTAVLHDTLLFEEGVDPESVLSVMQKALPFPARCMAEKL